MSKDINRAFREFRKIPSLRFLYEINGDGSVLRNVKSKRRIKIWKDAHNSKTEYWKCQINHGHRVIKKHFIHNLVAECWLGEKPEGYMTDHIDQNSLNNDYRNLRYVTRSENMKNRDYSKFQDKIWANLAIRNGGKMLEITLSNKDESRTFPSSRQAAQWLAKRYPEKTCASFLGKFRQRRSHLFDYDVRYREYYPLKETTGHGRSEEQGTV